MDKKSVYLLNLIFLTGVLLLATWGTPAEKYLQPDLVPGEITENTDRYGPFILFTSTNPSDPPQSLVVIHGTPAKDLTAGETALYYVEHWAPIAEEQGWLLLVPAFNQDALRPE